MLKKFTFLLFVAAVLAGKLKAQYVPITLTGFNADVVANGVGAPSTTTTATLDNASPSLGYPFVAQDYQYDGSCSLPTAYLPTGGALTSPVSGGSIPYQLASYAASNCLHLSAGTATGTLTFATPISAGQLFFAANSGGGASTVDVTVTFTDATSQTFTAGLSIADWYGTAGTIITKAARVNVTATACGSESATNGPNLYQYSISLSGANYTKLISSISFTRATSSAGFPNIMAVTAKTTCAVPAAQPTGLTFGTTSISQIDGSFTAASPAADQYLVVRYPAGATPVAPANGTVYTAGNSIGTGTVVYAGTGTTFSAAGLNGSTSYDFYVYSAATTAVCSGPIYNITTPLTGTKATVACGGPGNTTIAIGAGQTYATLTAALASLSVTGITGPVILELQGNYSSAAETYPITFGVNPCVSATKGITVRPATGVTGLVISSNATATIDINGGKYIAFDGRPGGTGANADLQIVNTSTTGVAVRLVNEASNNAITYCDLQGQNTTVASGTTASSVAGVVFIGGTTGTNGNDNNFIGNCNIHANGAGYPSIGIFSYGNTATVDTYNDNNIIASCKIYDYFLATGASVGIKLDAGTNAWNITGNSLYQTATRTYTTAAITHRGLWITPNVASIANTASGMQITNNYIGGSAPQGGGSPYTMSGSVTYTFMGMDISVGAGTPSSIQANTISNITMTTTSTSTTGTFTGIGIANGNVDIGTTTGNTIGSGTATGAINITNGSSGTTFGIRLGSGNTVNIANNTIGGINVAGASGTVSVNFIGIGTGGGTTTTVTNNVIGSTTVASSISNAASTSTTAQSITGINIANGTTVTVTGNTVANLTNNYNSTGAGLTRGIVVTTGLATVNNNTVWGLTNTANTTGSGASGAVVGIVMSSTTANATVTGNKIHSLHAGSVAANVNVVGIYIGAATSGNNVVAKNFIHSLSAVTTGTSAYITGMDIGAGSVIIANNMLRLGLDSLGNSITAPYFVRGITRGSATIPSKFVYNTVFIGGTDVSTGSTANSFAFQRNSVPASGNDTILNNIFVNQRSNVGSGPGKHYAVYFNTNINNLYLNNNLYYVTGTDAWLGYNGTTDLSGYSSGWIGSDANSISADPKLIAPLANAAGVNLHISTSAPTPIESAGTPFYGINDDYDGNDRSAATPVDIGADAGNFTALDVAAPAISNVTQLAYTCLTGNRTVTANITDASGVPVTGSFMPKLYFKKATTSVWSSVAGTLTSGTAKSGTWSFVISASTLGGVAAGDHIDYFVIAQDIVSPANVVANPALGVIAADVNNIAVYPNTPYGYDVTSGPLPSPVTFTPSVATVCSTTGTPVLIKTTGGQISSTMNVGNQSGQNTSTTYPAPFSNYYGGARHQFLVLASELSAAGYVAGSSFSSINFNVVSLGSAFSGTCQNFQVKMGHTTAATISTFLPTTSVFGPASVSPTVGYNNEIAFSSPFVWNGTDNLVIETTYSNGNTGNTNTTVIMYTNATSFQSSIVYRADGASATTIETATAVSSSYSARPDFKLAGTINTAITWSPVTGLFSNSTGTTPYVAGTAVDSVYAFPTATTTYIATATSLNGCSNTGNIVVTHNCTPTPVTFTSFTADRKEGYNLLQWNTANETNNRGFEIQKSVDARTFGSIGFVNSKAEGGNANASLHYTFNDDKQSTATVYYRLKQVDKDGAYKYSEVAVVRGVKVAAAQLVNVYPNPAKDQVTVAAVAPKAGRYTLTVTDVTGKAVSTQTVTLAAGDNQIRLNVAALTQGNYFIRLLGEGADETNAARFVKQ